MMQGERTTVAVDICFGVVRITLSLSTADFYFLPHPPPSHFSHQTKYSTVEKTPNKEIRFLLAFLTEAEKSWSFYACTSRLVVVVPWWCESQGILRAPERERESEEKSVERERPSERDSEEGRRRRFSLRP
jgi:hypothetical protein